MAIVSIEDLLDRADRFEERLVAFYAEVRDRTKEDGVRLLTYYLVKHRKHLAEALGQFDADRVARIKKNRLKYDVEFKPGRRLLESDPEQVTGRGLLEGAVECDLELVAFYKAILDQPLAEEARAVLEALVRVEERDIVMLKKTMATNYF